MKDENHNQQQQENNSLIRERLLGKNNILLQQEEETYSNNNENADEENNNISTTTIGGGSRLASQQYGNSKSYNEFIISTESYWKLRLKECIRGPICRWSIRLFSCTSILLLILILYMVLVNFKKTIYLYINIYKGWNV